MRRSILIGCLLAFCSAHVSGQNQARRPYFFEAGDSELVPVPGGDYVYHVGANKVEFRIGDVRVRADRIVLVLDRDEDSRILEAAMAGSGIPKRESTSPITQSEILARSLRKRIESRLGSKGNRFDVPPGSETFAPLTRGLLAEGNVVFEKASVRTVRCDRLWLSLASDRATMENVQLRLPPGSPLTGKGVGLVLRAPRLVQQGPTLVARDASLTTCDAGASHFDLSSERLVITQRGDVIEVLGQGNSLRAGALPALPLPDYRWYSDQENWIPLRGISAGVSDERGEFVIAEFGGRLNDIGQSIVDFFGGAQEAFRGEWRVRTGWTRKRGTPIEARLEYRVPELFDGWTEGFFLRDLGRDRRSVAGRLDGSPILTRRRTWVRSRNRYEFREGRRLDIEGFWASDPAAYAEFRPDQLKELETPETSIDLRDRQDNRLLSATGRWNLVDFVYDDTARLTDRFGSERPYVRGSLFSQPLFDIAEDTPVVVDIGVGAGLLRNTYDDRSALSRREQAFRADIELELSAPVLVGDLALRPWVQARETMYSERNGSRSSSSRTSLAAGVTVDTRLRRSFDFTSELLGIHGLWHDVRPTVHVFHRFDVDREPMDWYQFDEVDALDEEAGIDIGLFQRLLTRRKSVAGDSYADTLVWLDLTQRVYPLAGRDNRGERLGLFAWEFIVTPGLAWIPLPNLRLLFEGERDWERNEFKTRNVGFATSIDDGPTFAAEWRSGADGDGTGSATIQAPAYRRWSLLGSIVWSFDRDELDSSTLQVVRHDHDWDWEFRFVKNELTQDTSFTLRFRPTLGGLVRRPRSRYASGSPAFGVLEGSGASQRQR